VAEDRIRDERPAIVVVEPEDDAMRRMADELSRYERDYRIVFGRSAEDALGELQALREA